MGVLPGAEPFSYDGSADIGVLLCHGFTGTPQSMRPWGEHLREAGLTVRCPRLPGHGTTWQDANRTRWADWFGTVDAAFAQLRDRCRSTFVFGLSMGGTLALRLAETRGVELAGLALVNPSVTTLRKQAALLPVLSRFVASMPPIAGDIAKPGVTELAYPRMPLRAMASLRQLWAVVRRDLELVNQPLLLLHSATDNVVEPINSRIVLQEVRSTDVREVVLPDSYHVATLDNDAHTIFTESVQFAERVHEERTRQTV